MKQTYLLCAGVVAGTRFVTPKKNNHLDQTIGIIWHKRSMLGIDNTAEHNVSQEKKKLSRNYLRWPYRHWRNWRGGMGARRPPPSGKLNVRNGPPSEISWTAEYESASRIFGNPLVLTF